MSTNTKTLTCIVCPRGCTLNVTLDTTLENPIISVEGHGCKRGADYAIAECTHPTRVLTTTAPTVDGGVVPCKTDRPIPRELLFDAMKVVNSISAPSVVQIGDVLIENLLETGENIVATANRN